MTGKDYYRAPFPLCWTASCFAILTDLLYTCSLNGVRLIDKRRGTTERKVDTKSFPPPLPLALYEVACASAATLLHVSRMPLTVLYFYFVASCLWDHLRSSTQGLKGSGGEGVGEQKIRISEITPDKLIKKHHQHSNIALIEVTVFSKCICIFGYII